MKLSIGLSIETKMSIENKSNESIGKHEVSKCFDVACIDKNRQQKRRFFLKVKKRNIDSFIPVDYNPKVINEELEPIDIKDLECAIPIIYLDLEPIYYESCELRAIPMLSLELEEVIIEVKTIQEVLHE
ncbi:hypothetical protein FJR03_04585 [Sulfurimonas marina]|uniref:Uncharacterized protein n=2 Tax=Sulfurimonas marina TaxID=2590551 RepID=A0A7M1AUF9_9BACT|nr:hypothetical protein FJR03_04585 [Sulfurimonas marina]